MQKKRHISKSMDLTPVLPGSQSRQNTSRSTVGEAGSEPELCADHIHWHFGKEGEEPGRRAWSQPRTEGRSLFPSALLAILKTWLCSFVPSHSGFWMSFLWFQSVPVSHETAKEGPSLHDLYLQPNIIILLNQ